MSVIDLSQLPAPEVVETLDFEVILGEMVVDLQARYDGFDALLESDPAYKVLEVAAYRELLLRQRVNDAARQVMLAYAVDSNLDHLGALLKVLRLEGEEDADYLQRILLSPDGYTTAGSSNSYVSHARDCDVKVKDATAVSPAGGQVLLTVLSTEGDGTPDAELLATVEAAVTPDDIRPLTDTVTVAPAAVIPYTISMTLEVYPGPDSSVIKDAALEALKEYTEAHHRLGHDHVRTALIAKAHQEGVKRVTLTTPEEDIVTSETEAAWCDPESIEVEVVIADDE